MSQEIETAYQVDLATAPDLHAYPYEDIEQTYYTPLAPDPAYPETAGVEWRIRKTTDASGIIDYTTTIKIGDKSSGSRVELETKLPHGAFGRDGRKRWSPHDRELYGHGLVRKRRYELDDNLVVDVLDPELHGPDKLYAEKEFTSPEEQADWQQPAWCIPGSQVPSNRSLAVPIVPRYAQREPHHAPASSAANLTAHLLEVAQDDKPLLVTVSGMSGSGKSTLARHLAAALDAAHIEADHLHLGASALAARYGEVNHDRVETYDYALAGAAALELAAGNAVRLPTYSYVTAEPTGVMVQVNPTASRNVVVEGLYASEVARKNEELLYQKDVTVRHVLVDTPLYVSVVRRMLRDTAAAGGEAPERDVAFTP